MSERFTLNQIRRIGLRESSTGGWFQPAMTQLNTQQQTGHKLWESANRGGKRAFSGMETIGGQLWQGQTDPTKFIKKFDPQNSSGAVEPALDIMQNMLNVARNPALQPGINPLGTILGGGLYGQLTSFMGSFGVSSKGSKGGNEKQDNEEEDDELYIDPIIIQLVKAALKQLNSDDAQTQSDLLNSNEYYNIQQSYYQKRTYTSNRMSSQFVRIVNTLFPTFRASQGLV